MSDLPGRKRVIVIGGGVVGVTTAWALAERGHQVELFEAEAEIATQASASNAGLLVPGDSLVWGTPAAIGMLAKALLVRKKAFIRVRAGAGLRLIPWGIRFLWECLPARMRRNIAAAHALSAYSLEELERVARDIDADFAFQRNGMAFLAADREDLAALARDRAPLADAGESFVSYSPQEFLEVDGAYAAAASTIGGVLHTPGAAHGDSEVFARALAGKAEAKGVIVHRSTPVLAVRRRGGRAVGIETSHGHVDANVVIVAAGARTREIARTAGVRLPILPAKGYAVTVPAFDPDAVPRIGGVDERSHVAFSRVVGGLRISSTAEFTGYDTGSVPADYESIRATGEALCPGNLDWERATFHVGWRPATPNGNPIIGWSRVPGLLINSGHGHLGWTQAAGSAQIIADVIGGSEPAIDIAPYAVP